MEKHKVHIVRAFTVQGRGGNAAGVVLHADSLSHSQKQQIAQGVGLSETAFVSHSESADVKVEFFTPNRQIAHCGHATVATFGFLRQKGLISGFSATKESIEGIHDLRFEDDAIFLSQKAPVFHGQDEALSFRALAALGLSKSALLPGQFAEVVNTGVNFLILPLISEKVLKEITPRFLEIEALSEDLGLIGFYPFFVDETHGEITAFSRMFAPRFGISEESATGMAAGPLGCFLNTRLRLAKLQFFLGQGYHMEPASPSRLNVQLIRANHQIQEVWVGGHATWERDMWATSHSPKKPCLSA